MKIKEAKGEVSLFHELPEFYEKNVKEQYAAGAVPGMTREPEVPDELVTKAKAYTDTAIITICRFPARAGTANARSTMKAMSCLRMRKTDRAERQHLRKRRLLPDKRRSSHGRKSKSKL